MNSRTCSPWRVGAKAALVFLLLGGLAACGTVQNYKGDPLPREEVAMIEWSGLTVKVINGKLPGAASSAEVLPGEQIITILYSPNLGLTSYSKTLIFDAEAGHSYELHAECGSFLKCKPFWAWVENQKGGEIITGRSPNQGS